MKTLGFIGAGNMAGAILQGVISKGFLPEENIVLYDINQAQCDKWRTKYPAIQIAKDNIALVQACDCVILAVKPVFLAQVLQEISSVASGKAFISIAAGWTNAMLNKAIGTSGGAQVLRVSPNTPAMVGEGYSVLCQEHTLDADTFEWANQLFQTLGTTDVFPERLFDAVIAVSGSSPAYCYMMIEAMADGAVKLGLPRQAAYRAAAQAMLGSAKMVLETGEHPGKLKDDVCSPAGTTIEAVYALEKGGMRSAVIAAMEACAEKCRQLSQEESKKEEL